jgi:biopolymer transport protein ExbD
VTPLIDVVMVLIVFYLIVAKLASDRLLPVELPGSAAGVAEERGSPIVVSVGRAAGEAGGEGREWGSVVVEVQGGAVEGRAALREAVTLATAARPGAEVHLRADRTLEYARVAPVVEVLREAGVRTLLLVASREDGEGVR